MPWTLEGKAVLARVVDVCVANAGGPPAKSFAETTVEAPVQIEERWARQVPLGRVGRPEEFADAVVSLASERASYITGVALAVNGGIVKGLY